MNTYEHYIALDWSESTLAIARMTLKSPVVKTLEIPTSLSELKGLLKDWHGKKILTFEESTPAQWLYVELRPFVDEILVCDPSRNLWLNEGAKTDRIDAEKMVQLLKAGLLKPVFHAINNDLLELRKLVSGYEDVVKAGVRLKNQEKCYLRRIGKTQDPGLELKAVDRFILNDLREGIERYEHQKERFEEAFRGQAQRQKMIRNLATIPGIGLINAVKIAAVVVDPRRFSSRNHFLSYCGLIKLQKISGGRSYGRKKPRYSRTLKSVFKTAMLVNLHPHNQSDFKDYYEYLIREKSYPEYQARHAMARRIATLCLGVLKTKQEFELRIGGRSSTIQAEMS